ncbi:MAG: bifunctional diguanylate cyclase/phosphodiesterase [Pseudanabaena sp. ELA645]|jgi:diguanylate cyclase (GGDEF)-like protein
MQNKLSETISALIECIDRISTSENLTKLQQDDLEKIKSLSGVLAEYCSSNEKEITVLKQRLKQFEQPSLDINLQNKDDIYTLLALMSARLRQSMDINGLLDTVVLEVDQLLHCDQIIIYELAEQFEASNQPIQYESVREPSRSLLGQSLPSIYLEPESVEVFQKCLSQVIDDMTSPDVDPSIANSLLPLGIRSAITIAIPKGKKLWGLIILHQYDQARPWQNWEIELLENLGTQLAILIHQIQLLVKSDAVRIERDQVLAKLQHNELHDSLTGLLNRDSFMELLHLAFTKFQTDFSYNFAVLFIDCDRLKSINDNFGIIAGDQLLKEISDRLKIYSNENASIARIDSDKFVVLVENINHNINYNINHNVNQIAREISNSIKQPFLVNGNQIFTSVSIGIALSDRRYVDNAEILGDATIAMQQSRKSGRGNHALFTHEMKQGNKVSWQLETDFRQALKRREFYLVYQPIVSLQELKLSGFEVLLRWLHPSKGLISPEAFIPIAEQTGEIIQIGYWVLETACDQLYLWQQQFPNIPLLTLGINASTLQVAQPDFVERIQEILSARQISPSLIKLEITESVLMENIEVSSQKLEKLRGIGIQVYIDDFGTGYSSFSYLQNLPIDVLKIDRSFTNKIFTNIKSQRIIQSILRLANNLGIGIVIEGVETLEELNYFENIGGSSIDIQGYFISIPLDSEGATEWIQQAFF